MIDAQRKKPTQPAISVKDVIPGIYGICPHCGDLCHVKRNLHRDRPQFKFSLERLGERG